MNARGFLRAHDIASNYRSVSGNAKRPLFAKSAASEGPAKLYFYDQIGAGWFSDGITAKDVIASLAEIRAAGQTAVDVHIASEGGDVWEGKAIYEALKRCGMTVTAYNDSIAASAASFIAMAASKIVSAPSCTWMVHCAWSMAAGNATDMRAIADILALEDGNIAKMYAAKTGKSTDECLALMAAETWMDAEQAKALGFTDEITDDSAPENEGAAGIADSALVRVAAATQQRIAAANRERLAALTDRMNTRASAEQGTKAGQPARTSTK